MPIRNGLLTCQDIITYFAQQKNFLPGYQSLKKKKQINHSRIYTNPDYLSIDGDLPHIIGLSSHLGEDIALDCWKAGFLYYSKIICFRALCFISCKTINFRICRFHNEYLLIIIMSKYQLLLSSFESIY